MNVKKIAAVGASAVMFLASATPAFATWDWWDWFHSEDTLVVHNEDTDVTANVWTKANTGGNEVTGGEHHGWWWWHHGGEEGGSVETGNAQALAEVGQSVNLTDVAGCGCFDDVTVHNDDTDVLANVWTKANTGWNTVTGAGTIATGNAGAGSLVEQMVNVTVVGE